MTDSIREDSIRATTLAQFAMSDSIGALALALSQAQAQYKTLRKTGKATHPKPREYATLDDVIEATRDALAANHVALNQFVIGDAYAVSVVTILSHESGDWIRSAITLAVDEEKGISRTQSMGKAITYLRRYAASSALYLAAETDDDAATDAHAKARSDAPAKVDPIFDLSRVVEIDASDLSATTPALFFPTLVYATVVAQFGDNSSEALESAREGVINDTLSAAARQVASALRALSITRDDIVKSSPEWRARAVVVYLDYMSAVADGAQVDSAATVAKAKIATTQVDAPVAKLDPVAKSVAKKIVDGK